MLTHISISGFKSIYQLNELALGRVNLFIGANGSGKTNILEAVGMLSAAASGQVDSDSLGKRGVRLSPTDLYRSNLRSQDPLDMIQLEANSEWIGKQLQYRVALVHDRHLDNGKWHYQAESLSHDGSELLNEEDIGPAVETEWINVPDSKQIRQLGGRVRFLRSHKLAGDAPGELNDFLRTYGIYSPSTPILRGMQPDPKPGDPVGLFGGRLAEAVADLLQSDKFGSLDLDDILELLDWVDRFQVTAPLRELLSPDVPTLRSIVEFQDAWMGLKRNRISGYDASEGSLYVLFALVLAMHPRSPRFLAVDNFGQALHPRLERALMRLFCRLVVEATPTRQVLLTTHNPLVLDGLNLRDDRIRLFAVERDYHTGGATKISRVELSEKVLKAAENGRSLSQMWVMGLLGGVPDIF